MPQSRLALLLLVLGSAVAQAQSLGKLDDVEAAHAAYAAQGTQATCPQVPVTLPVDLAAAPNLDIGHDAAKNRLTLRYRMNFNQVTEGWNWNPDAALAGDDYYRHKFLPLLSRDEQRASYASLGIDGAQHQIAVSWRYDYFFAFDNLYDFFPRSDDDAGFSAEVAMPAADAARLVAGDLAMALRGRLAAPCHAESTTFWKSIHSKPVDFTLKKRYLMGLLDEVLFYDRRDGKLLARQGRQK